MSKKDKKIEIQVADAKVNVGKDSFEGYTLTILYDGKLSI